MTMKCKYNADPIVLYSSIREPAFQQFHISLLLITLAIHKRVLKTKKNLFTINTLENNIIIA